MGFFHELDDGEPIGSCHDFEWCLLVFVSRVLWRFVNHGCCGV